MSTEYGRFPPRLQGYIFLALLVVVPSGHRSRAQSTLEVSFSEDLTIGLADEPHSFFSNVKAVRVDAAGNIFVADAQAYEVRMFDSNGAFVRGFGSRGQGPGEFEEIYDVQLDANGSLLVSDRRTARLTLFTTADDEFDTLLFENARVPTNASIVSAGDSLLLLFSRILRRDAVYANSLREDELFHVVERDLSTEFQSFGSRGALYDVSDPLEKQNSYNGEFYKTLVLPGELWVSPVLYQGTLAIYCRRDGEWTVHIVQAPGLESPSHTLITEDDFNDLRERTRKGEPVGYLVASYSSGSDPVHAVIHRTSLGPYRLSTGQILHFFKVHEADRSVLFAELFESDGTYLGRAEADAGLDSPEAHIGDVHAIDARDRIYVDAWDASGTPVVKRMKLHVSREDG